MMVVRVLIAMGLAATVVAPANASSRAPAGVAAVVPQAGDTATLSYEVGGLRVIHRPLAANEIVSVNLYLLGGSQQLDAATAGIEAMLLRASELGTEGFPGMEARLALARTGSRTILYTEADWTVFGFRGIRTEFDATWSVFADRIMRPTLDEADVEVVRQRMLRSRRAMQNHPDAMLQLLADSVTYADHPYRHDPEGTVSSLAGITVEAMRGYHESQMVTSRMLLVIVGNVPRPQVEAAIEGTLAQLPRGEHVWTLPQPWSVARATVTARPRQLATNYILGYFAGPSPDSEDYPAFRVATMLLGGIASSEIRSNGLSYAAYSPLLERGASAGGVYVTTAWPDSTMRVFNSTIRLLQQGASRRSVLQRYFDGFITSYYGENESNAGQADFLARYELLHGDWRLSARYMDDLKGVQSHQISAAARRYMRNIQYVYVGNVSRVPEREMTRF